MFKRVVRQSGFTLSEVLMALTLLTLIILVAMGILQWTLYNTQTQQAASKASFLAQSKMEELLAQETPQAVSGQLEEGFNFESTIRPLDEYMLEIAVRVRGPANSLFILRSQRRASLRELLLLDASTNRAWLTAEDYPDLEPVRGDFGIGYFGQVCFSGNSRQIAYVASRKGIPQIYVRTLSGPGRQVFSYPTGAQEPNWSPDGKYLAFTSQENGYSQVMVYSTVERVWRNWSNNRHHENSPVWMPDGRTLIAVRDSDELVTIDADGRKTTIFENSGGWLVTPSVSSDGKYVVFMGNQDGNPELYIFAATGGRPRRVTDNPSTEQNPQFSPDGRRVLFLSNREDGSCFRPYTINTDGSGLVEIAANHRITDCFWVR